MKSKNDYPEYDNYALGHSHEDPPHQSPDRANKRHSQKGTEVGLQRRSRDEPSDRAIADGPDRTGSVLRDKTSDAYVYYSNDLREHRFHEWSSVWFQAKEPVTNPNVHSVLEFGVGRGVTKAIIEHFGIRHVGVDVNDELFVPDVCSTIDDFGTDERFDMVCAFEVLEHNPFEKFADYMSKFRCLANKYVYISLPFSGRWFTLNTTLNLPKLRVAHIFSYAWQRWFKKQQPIEEFKKREDPYAPHWWEVGDRNTPLKVVRTEIEKCGLRIRKEVKNPLHPGHIFFYCERV